MAHQEARYCNICGKILVVTGKGREKLYCSAACSQKAKRIRHNEKNEQNAELALQTEKIKEENKILLRLKKERDTIGLKEDNAYNLLRAEYEKLEPIMQELEKHCKMINNIYEDPENHTYKPWMKEKLNKLQSEIKIKSIECHKLNKEWEELYQQRIALHKTHRAIMSAIK